MLPTIIFGFALLFSIITTMLLVLWFISIIDFDIDPEDSFHILIYGLIGVVLVCVTWSYLFYLLH